MTRRLSAFNRGSWLRDRLAALALGLALVSAAMAAGPAAAAGPTAAAASPPRCLTANLRLDKTGENDFTSHRGWIFALRNVSSRTCQLDGYPSARLLDHHARLMPTRGYRFGGGPPSFPAVTPVTLAPWHRAFFSMLFAVAGPCPGSVTAYGVRFLPPGASRGLIYYAGRFDLCGPGPAQVGISPLRSSPQF